MVTWARDIASGIQYLHSDAPVTVIHRDLKSSNVVITAENVCKLCDFGTSKSVQQSTHRSLAGTFAWMSPEMLRSEVVTTASDIYSFGVVLWELVTRQIPFKGLEDFTIMYQVAQNHVRLPIPESCPFKVSTVNVFFSYPLSFTKSLLLFLHGVSMLYQYSFHPLSL